MSKGPSVSEDTKFSLYYYDSCPFCMRVLTALRGVKVKVELRNIMSDPNHRNALYKATRRTTVPCLRIDNGNDSQWMFESMDIMRFLQSL